MNTTEQKLEIAITALNELANRGVNSSHYNHHDAQLAIVNSTPDDALIYFSGYVDKLDASVKQTAREVLSRINEIDNPTVVAPEVIPVVTVPLSDVLDEFAEAVISGNHKKAKSMFPRIGRYVGINEMQALDDLWSRVASFGRVMDKDFLYQVALIKKQYSDIKVVYNEAILR